jgi:hypothetical protein
MRRDDGVGGLGMLGTGSIVVVDGPGFACLLVTTDDRRA